MKPIFIAGPHGSGKTTLISKLIVKSDRFIKDDYEIDFSNDMETLSSMTIFEKCLIRLYHRFYTAELAIKKCGMSKENDKILVVDRSIYDSLVYIEAFLICDMKKYVILDIDRTIINGTSWYHACSCPNLLIDEYNIDRFKELNNKMYVHGTSKDRYEFRKQTFELINKRVSESAYRKLSECGCADEILIGQNVNEVFFEAVGIYTYKKLMKSDEDCKKIVDFIYKYYFGDIEFIFLTSGYEPFMKGLVKEYMKSFHKNCTWRTIGSTIKFSNGCIYLKEVMTQEKKFQFVKKIIDYGNRVVFLADDSVEEKELFSVVFRNGGYPLMLTTNLMYS